MSTRTRRPLSIVSALLGATLALACADDGGGDDELGASETQVGDGDGDGDGDGQDQDGDGDGDGDGQDADGDGDGDPGDGDGDPGDGDGDPNCSYPDNPAEPMALGEVLWPYSWPVANRADGTEAVLDLGNAPCDIDEVIDWSPHDILVFISIPAW